VDIWLMGDGGAGGITVGAKPTGKCEHYGCRRKIEICLGSFDNGLPVVILNK